MSSILKGLLHENSKRTIKSVADEIANYIGDSPSDSAIVDAVEHEAKIHGFDPSKLFDAVYDHFRHHIDENLHKWFKEKWVRFGPDGKIRGSCARGDDSEGKPKCLPQKKAQNLGKKGRKYAASKKRREDPNPERTGKAKNVATKKKTNEDAMPEFMKAGNMKPFTASGKEIPGSVATLEKLLVKAKERGIKLNYQNIDQMMQAVAKKHHLTGDELHNEFVEKNHMIPDDWIVKQLDEACWKGYHKEGNKKMFGKTYPNCVKNTNEEQELDEKWSKKYKASINCSNPKGFSQKAHCAGKKKNEDMNEEKCPHCGGELVSEELMNEKQDACYHKVKSRYKVWPSAYASGALVQCRKKGAKNWGNKTSESSIMKGIVAEDGERVSVIYIDGKPNVKYTNIDDAKEAVALMKKKHPKKNFEIKQEMRESAGEPVSVVYIDGKAVIKYTNIDDAKEAVALMKKKHPKKNFEIKQEMRESGYGQSIRKFKPKVAGMKTEAEETTKPVHADGEEKSGAVATLEKRLLAAKKRGDNLSHGVIDRMMLRVCKDHQLTGDKLHDDFVKKHKVVPDKWIAKQVDEAANVKPQAVIAESKMSDIVKPLVRAFNIEHGGDEKWADMMPLHTKSSAKRWRRGDGSYYTDPSKIVAFDQSDANQRALEKQFFSWLTEQPGAKRAGQIRGEFKSSDYAEAAKFKGLIFINRGSYTEYTTPSRLRNPDVWHQQTDKPEDDRIQDESSIMKGLTK